MQLITVAGPPSVGKTSVIAKTAKRLTASGLRLGAVKFDSLSTSDDEVLRRAGLKVAVGLAGGVCPDHFFVSNIDDCLSWARRAGLDMLIAESAGLCNRCSPHIRGVTAVCVVDNLSGVHTPQKIGPMLKLADVVVITKADIVSQAEREVFAHHAHLANPRADLMFFNGVSGQGAAELAGRFAAAPQVESLEEQRLRFPMPSAMCSYCVGETAIGRQHQRGNVRKMKFEEPA
jgi:Ni2+-binding GTPase involved in maturation of urease and hydrogenase